MNGQQALPRIKFKEKLGFCTFSTASNVVYQFKSLYYLFFLTNVLKMDVLIAGAILTIGTIWDAINDPIIGFWAVNQRFKSGERCRPLAIWFAVPWAITVVLLFTDFNVVPKATVAISLIVYILFEVFNTFVGIPYNSMAGLATNLDADRRSINVFRNLGGCFGSGIGAVACLPLLKLFGGLDRSGNLIEGQSARGFLLTAIVMGVVCILGCIVHYCTTRERVQPINSEDERLSVKTVARMLFRCRSWIFNTLYIICYGIVNLLLMSCVTYYATYVVGSTAAATPIQAAYLVVSVAVSLLVSPVDKRLGRKKTMICAAVIGILGKIWFVLNPFSIAAIYVNAVTAGVAITIAFVMFNTNRNNIVDLIEWKDGRRLDSLVSTADNLASKLATAFATLLVTTALKANGFDAELAVQPDSAITAICGILGWVPMLVCAAMLVVVFFLDIEKDTRQMLKEKAEALSKAGA
ncbi:MAG: glycoside-pentoside-hexuronide (GPH):cation symporter [Clostridia bacterium]|nr:glycoside-pentoside-hexuronide (GPH):cation symporter [Clostridia bacterium]